MRRTAILTALALVFAAPALAQDAQRGRGRGGGMLDRLIGRLQEQLQLSEDQLVEVETVAAEYRAQFAERRAQAREMRDMFRELRAARDAGNTERETELTEQINAAREQMRENNPFGRRGPLDAFFEEITPVLTEGQAQQLAQIRERMAQRRGGRRNGMRQLRQLRQELNLTPEQQSQFDELVRSSREQMRESREERMAEARPLFEQMRTAIEEGDTERAGEIRRQLREMRRESWQGRMNSLFDELEQILTPEQQQVLSDFRTRMEQRGDRRGRERQREIRYEQMLRIARSLELTAEQQEELRSIEEDARAALRELETRDRTAMNSLARGVRQEILLILTEEQTQRFNQMIQRLDRRGNRDRDRERDRPRDRRRDTGDRESDGR